MTVNSRRLTRLSAAVEARVRSAIQISSLHDVVLGLVVNSLDANAQHIRLSVDFSRGSCSILDDGDGILAVEFSEHGRLTQPYYTSRDPRSNIHYGRFGRFLSSLCSVSLLSISSQHYLEDTVHSAVFKDGRCIATSEDSDSLQFRHGTKVVVNDLFGSMPVRVKFHAAKLDSQERYKTFEHLKRLLVELILAAPKPFFLEMTDAKHVYRHRPRWLGDAKFDLGHIVSTFFQAGMVEQPNTTGWEKASVYTPDFEIQAAIRLQPIPTKSKQFIAINQYPLPPHLSDVFDQINAIFDASDFGCAFCEEKDAEGGNDIMSAKANRWPVFWIRIGIEQLDLETTIQSRVDELMGSISIGLRALIREFLQSHGFTIVVKQKKKTHSVPLALRPSSLDAWSRIKSTGYSSRDLLAGLPFVSQPNRGRDSKGSYPQASGPSSTGCLCPHPDSIQWINPRTGQVLFIDPATEMALPPHASDLRHLPPVKRLSDIVSTVKDSKEGTSSIERMATTDTGFCISDNVGIMHVGPNRRASITKQSLRTLNVLGQADKKFILATLQDPNQGTILIAIDQHAADERIKFEQLLKQNQISVSVTPITFDVEAEEKRMFWQLKDYFLILGINYIINVNSIKVSALPESIAERCRQQPTLIIELLRTEIWRDRKKVNIDLDDHWLSKIGIYPQSLIDMMASRACRSAIMFNDVLTLSQCKELVHQLCDCVFPFQCAHGRPSLTVLACIQSSRQKGRESFGQSWRAWVL